MVYAATPYDVTPEARRVVTPIESSDASSEPNTFALAAQADRSYNPPPSFADFAASVNIDLAPLQRAFDELVAARANAESGAAANVDRVLLRTAAVDTGAVEGLYPTNRGFTFNVAAGLLSEQAMAAESGPNFVRLFDAQLLGFEMALDAATGNTPISELWLRQLHAVIVHGQPTYRVFTSQGVQERPLVGGEYKQASNHVRLADGGVHAYAPVDETPREIRRVIEEMRTDAFLGASLALQVSYAHYALVAVHPFADGNGRVSRALAERLAEHGSSAIRLLSLPPSVAGNCQQYVEALTTATQHFSGGVPQGWRGDVGSAVPIVRIRLQAHEPLSASAVWHGTVLVTIDGDTSECFMLYDSNGEQRLIGLDEVEGGISKGLDARLEAIADAAVRRTAADLNRAAEDFRNQRGN